MKNQTLKRKIVTALAVSYSDTLIKILSDKYNEVEQSSSLDFCLGFKYCLQQIEVARAELASSSKKEK